MSRRGTFLQFAFVGEEAWPVWRSPGRMVRGGEEFSSRVDLERKHILISPLARDGEVEHAVRVAEEHLAKIAEGADGAGGQWGA